MFSPLCATSIRPLTLMLARYVVFAAALLCFATANSYAGQIAFAFDATVYEIDATPGFAETLPFVPSVGQVMSGKVTFTPIAFGQVGEPDAKLEIAWQEETFTGATNTLLTINDYAVSPGFPFDNLSVSCGVSQNCITPTFPITVRELSVVLSSFQDAVPSGQLMDSLAAWNQFDIRQLLLVLSNADDTKLVRTSAVVGPLRLIPEPATTTLVLCGICLEILRPKSKRLRTWWRVGALVAIPKATR